SGGWKQRLALGGRTLPNPQLLLLGEPTARRDPKGKRGFWNETPTLASHRPTELASKHYMGQGGRCPQFSYIAFGELLARGTVDELIKSSHLTTYVVSARNGEGLSELTTELTDKPGIDMVAPFGTSLHVSGRDEAALETAIAPYRKQKNFDWE